MQETILRSSIRAFFVALCAVLGIIVAFFVVVLLSAGSFTDDDIDTTYSTKIVPNGQGIRKALSSHSPIILQLDIHGLIGTEVMSMKTVQDQFMESREGTFKDDRVKAVLLKINTPGGTVIDADGIYRTVMYYKEKYKVPVYAYVDGLCASGGMYIACAADKIFASDVSVIGSIGVITPTFMNYTQLLEKIGVQSKTVFAGKNKDMLNPFRPWGDDEAKEVQELINYYYNSFVNIVLTNRTKVNKEELVKTVGADVMPAEDAVKLGLIDKSGANLYDTITALAEAANLKEGSYQVVELENKNWLQALLKMENPFITGKITHHISFPDELNPKLMNQFLYLYRPESFSPK